MIRKTIFAHLLVLAVLFAVPVMSNAATVGNIASSQGGGGGASVGVEYDRVFKRDLDFQSGERIRNTNGVITSDQYLTIGDRIKDMEMESNRVFVKGTLGFDRDIDFDLFLKLGAADVKWKAKHDTIAQNLEFDGEMDFAWGGGAKFGFYESPCGLRFSADIQYLTYTVDGKFKVNGIDRATVETPAIYDTKTKIEEWQGALYLQQMTKWFGPYLGVKYSDMNLKNEVDVTRSTSAPYSYHETTEADAKNNVGVVVGTDIWILQKHLSVNLEGRFVDETAGSIGLNYTF